MRYIIALVFLSSCLSAQKAGRQLDKINEEYPELISDICSKEYPCLPRKADTLTKVEYDFIEIECPDGQIPATSRDSTDTVYVIKYNEKRVTKEVRIPCESKIITQYLEDTAKVSDLSNRLDRSNKAYIKASEKAKKAQKLNWILGLILALLILVLYLRRKK